MNHPVSLLHEVTEGGGVLGHVLGHGEGQDQIHDLDRVQNVKGTFKIDVWKLEVFNFNCTVECCLYLFSFEVIVCFFDWELISVYMNRIIQLYTCGDPKSQGMVAYF